ncbi:RHS repeat-associated core domain-containing protein [Micromonospora haikouensis]|uniref:RHS repeat-associated core domain-containing protein n=1 Tax=Micromonospora haikouensis TaxID=686309 RepID=UPI003D940043
MRWARRRTLRRSGVAVSVAVVMLATLTGIPAPVAEAAEPTRAVAKPVPTVPVSAVKSRLDDQTKHPRAASAKPAPVWPAGGTAVVDLTSGQPGKSVPAGGSPVQLRPASGTGRSAATDPQRVRLEVLDRAATHRAQVRGVLLSIDRADGAAGAGRVDLTVDYRSFATAYGADWSSRLRLVSLPACALRTPEKRQCTGTPLPSRNDLAARTVTATVPVNAVTSLIAVTAAPSGPAGDYSATPLQPSSTWSAGGNSGAFTWSYPMRVPPAPGGPAPQVELAYSSQSVDGRHAASNNQPSWVGEGFEAWPGGHIERRYRACAEDMDGSANNDLKTGDQCWETDNATLSLNGHSGELIYNSSEDRWHLRNDDGSRVERKTGAANGDNDGEYWVVTTTDGKQYWFGAQRLPGWASGDPVTNSTWTMPVFGNDPGEPCHATAYADSDCVQAWRWNLDYVVDLHGNSASYWYVKETNKYGRNRDADDDASYDRGGWLDRIDYGTRRDSGVESVLDSPAPLRVDFAVADRCLSGCATHDEAHWPDTPWDSECTGTSCTDNFAPTFWTTKRLVSVTTQVRDGSSYRDVERWTLTHTFPDPGDGTRAGLWLDRISHAGLVGATTTVPDIEFTSVQLSNRVDTEDFAAAMNWMRITKIRTESGGTTSVTYSAPDCVAGQTPTPHTNTRRCYPVIWTPEGYQNPVTDWFHKYVVTTIFENNNTAGVPPQGSPRVAYSYSYLDGAAWHYNDDDGIIDSKRKTWSDFRGYGRVGVTVGDPGEQTYAETRYFRGMNGDRATPTGGTRSVSVDGIADEDWYAGTVRESKTFNGPGGPVVSRGTSDPWASAATATRTVNGDTVTARFTRIGTSRSYTMLDAGRGERVTRTTTSFDAYGMPVSVDDFGDDNVAGDEQCTKTDYTPRNTSVWLMDRVHRMQSYAVKCADAATPTLLSEGDVIGETRTSYDGNAFEATPTRGLATRTEEIATWNSGVPTFTTVAQAGYDTQGRVVSSRNAMNYETKTAYTPASGGPVTATTVTNPLLHVATTTLEPAWGTATATVDANGKRTDLSHDGLGRLTSVWLPGRTKGTDSADRTFAYQVRNDAATVVTTAWLNAQGNYVTTYAFYDGLLRPRQTQVPSPSGGRLLTDTFYDTAGRQVKTFDPYHAAGTPGTTLVTATEQAFVPTQARTVYDGAGRATASIFQPYDTERWRTSTYYAGDRTDVTPPAGGTATSAVTDARGRTVQLRQYHGVTPTPGIAGSWDTSTYTYNRKGQLVAFADPAGNEWTHTYDIRGRQTTTDDPDKGVTTFTYDNASRITATEDARGQKLAYRLDPLDRKREVYEGQIGGILRAQWGYDTLAKGQLTFSTRFVGSAAYQVKVTGYTDSYQPTGTQFIIPTSETGLGGTYNFFNVWNRDGSLASTSLPSTNGDLPAETLQYGYSDLGLPTTLGTLYGAGNLSYVEGTDYNALGQASQYHLYSGSGGRVQQAFTRELETGRLTGIRTDRDSTTPYTLVDVRYTYDAAGNIVKAQDVTPAPVDDTQCFGYDYLRRLTQAWTPSSGDCVTTPTVAALGGPAPYWHGWTFDTVGNRLTQTQHTSVGNATTTYTYPAAGSPQPHALTATSGAQTGSYTYDQTGNTLTRPTNSSGAQTLSWDAEGRLDTSTDTTGTTRYIYDADGNRLIRRDPTGSTLYLPGQELRYTTATGATTCTRYYSHAGVTIASRTVTSLNWLSSDHHGTAQVSVAAISQQATIRRQLPYGQDRGAGVSWPNDKGFVGGTLDNTGLTHLGAREYDSTTGRFISVDPIQDLADPQQWHGYAYSHNNPTTFSDPSGLIDEDCAKVAGGCSEYKPGNEQANRRSKQKNSCWPVRCTSTMKRNDPRTLGHVILVPEAIDIDRFTQLWNDSLGDVIGEAKGWDPSQVMHQEFDLAMQVCGVIDDAACRKWIQDVLWPGYWATMMPLPDEDGLALPVGMTSLGRAALPPGAELPTQTGVTPAWQKSGSCSFAGDTNVLLADGTVKPIKEIKIGDEVLATDPVTGEQGPRTVTHLWIHEDELVALSVGGADLTTTEDHPFWNASDHQWQPAADLDQGDLLTTPAGTGVLVGKPADGLPRRGTAYNLSVNGLHTYYVLAGNTPVLVHNTCFSTRYENAGDIGGKYRPGQSSRDPASQWYHEELSNKELLDGINNPASGDGILVSRDGMILGGHHRLDELQRRVNDGRIDPSTPIRIDVYDGE